MMKPDLIAHQSPSARIRTFASYAGLAVLMLLSAAPSRAAVIYSTGFESGTLGSEWTTSSELPGGRIAPSQAILSQSWGNALPRSGDWFLGMDHETGGSDQTNEAWLNLDLSGRTGVMLDFWWAEWDEEDHPQDGVFISDDGGSNFVKIQDLFGDSYTDLTWNNFVLDLSTLAAGANMTLTSNFVIKFQQRDDYYFNGGNDGFLIDDIVVYDGAAEVPEPATMWLLLSGGALMLFRRRKRS